MKNRNFQTSPSISRSPRFVFIAGALALTASLFPIGGANSAHAIDKADAYKAGAAALGVLGAYYGVKGKNVPAIIAGAGAYYAYKKGRDADRDANNNDRYRNRRSDNRNTYPEDYNRYPDNGGYRAGNYGYPDNNYPDYNRYPDNRYPSNRNGDVYAGGYDQYPDYGYNGLKKSDSKSRAKSGSIRVK